MTIACIQESMTTIRDRFSELEELIDKKIESQRQRDEKLRKRYAWRHPRRRR